MRYLVRLTERAMRDIESIHEFVGASFSGAASVWFGQLAKAIYSLERSPQQGAVTPEDKSLRQLLFGKKPNVYRIIYEVDKRRGIVNVVHIRHGARASLSTLDDVER